jgi:thiol-disulfide isomerase/thioredoxin/predicted nuclease of restriction endonuclease-like (RecB) superfamily
MNKLLYGIIFGSLLLFSCEDVTNSSKSIPNLPLLFSTEAELLDSLKPSVFKSVNDTDNITTNDIVWTEEFAFFKDFETTYQKNKSEYIENKFVVNNKDTKLFEYDVLEYTTKNKSLLVTKATYHLINDSCFKAIFLRNNENTLLSNTQTLIYEPNVGYSIIGVQQIEGINKISYHLNALFKNSSLWRAELNIGKDLLPFNFSMDNGKVIIYNATEQIKVNDIVHKADSVFIKLPYFDSEIKAKVYNDSIVGYWYNYAKDNHSIPFFAIKNNSRFDFNEAVNSIRIDGKWEVMFSEGTDDEYPAIGVFKQDGNYLTGTFITETGDYRYLEGYIEGKDLKLSCFDGAHAFLFTGSINDEGGIDGKFHSGKHWTETWTAKSNENATIQDPYSLTHLTTTDSIFKFSFLNMDSIVVSLDDEKYINKPVIVQIMGSWCPNCIDESKLLAEFYNDYNSKGLEVVALCFERSTEFTKNKTAIEKVKTNLNIPYEMLLAGKASKKEAAKALPMLNHIMSYPTTIYLNKNHKVQRIHTGFYGPGTGAYYTRFVTEARRFIESLIQ